MKPTAILAENEIGSERPTPLHLIAEAEHEAFAATQPDGVRALLRANGFKGEKGRLVFFERDGAAEAALGVGDGTDPLICGAAAAVAPAGLYQIAGELSSGDGAKAALGWGLGAYRFTAYKSSAKDAPRLVAPGSVDIEAIRRHIGAAILTRDLVNTPANHMGPQDLANAAEDLAKRHGATFDVIVGDDLLAQNFPMVHAVGRASVTPPRLIDMVWGTPSAPKVTLVGKGVCFDSGGLNIKPGSAMALMKKDMGGAANVLGLAHMIMDAALPVRLRVLIPAVENAISGDAFRPGDILNSRKGITVEIGNTDAEGRLILADALTYACEEAPELLVDMATLTGAARVALGPDMAPFYTDDETLAAQIAAAAEPTADPVWRMPLWQGYESWLDSKAADCCHISDGPLAGSVTAALFLKKFVTAQTPWVHFDIYAWTPRAKPGRPVGGEMQGPRALFEVLKTRYGG